MFYAPLHETQIRTPYIVYTMYFRPRLYMVFLSCHTIIFNRDDNLTSMTNKTGGTL